MANPRLCSIPGCGKRHYARSWCNPHYQRWRLLGDPLNEGGKKPRRFLREIVLPYDSDDCLIWPFSRNRQGYATIGGPLVSRIVCEAAHGPPPTPEHEAAHSCGNGHEGCVTPRHLRWATRLENMADMQLHDTHARGERHGNAKLTEADVREIRRLAGTIPQRRLAAMLGVSYGTVASVIYRKSWDWLN